MAKKDIITQLDQKLKPLGFLRKGSAWNRKIGSVVEVVDLQLSSTGDRVTVNVGVLDSNVYTVFWGAKIPNFIEQPICTVGLRIGELIDGRDKWWLLSDSNADVEIVGEVNSRVLPFFQKMHVSHAMENWLVTNDVRKKKYLPPIINLAILMIRRGATDEGCKLFDEIQAKPAGLWKVRIAEISARIGCAK